MDEQKKQKTLLAVVAVLVLGAGSMWYFNRDTSSRKIQAAKSGPVKRRERERSTQAERPDKGRAIGKKRTPPKKAVLTRREREKTEQKMAKRRERGRQGIKKPKKKGFVRAG